MEHAHHFLSRLDRVADPEKLKLALELYNNPSLVASVVELLHPSRAFTGIAISLDKTRCGPWVVVAKNGEFITCLEHGMAPRPGDLRVGRETLLAAIEVAGHRGRRPKKSNSPRIRKVGGAP
jgi:hypothetical protein